MSVSMSCPTRVSVSVLHRCACTNVCWWVGERVCVTSVVVVCACVCNICVCVNRLRTFGKNIEMNHSHSNSMFGYLN